jgi:hypothetical protein
MVAVQCTEIVLLCTEGGGSKRAYKGQASS